MILSDRAKAVLAAVLLMALLAGGAFLQRFAYVDFSTLRFGLEPRVSSDVGDIAAGEALATEAEFPNRDRHLSEARAS